MHHLPPCELERWYSAYGFQSRYHLSSAAAPPLGTAELLAIAGPPAREEYLALDLNYVPPQGTPALRAAIARQYRTLDASEIQVTSGAAEALLLLLHALLAPGDTLVVQFPIYPSIYRLAAALGAHVVRWPMGARGEIDLALLDELVRAHRPRAVILNHPHGPSGALLAPAELRQIAELTEAGGALLVVDEVYRGIQFSAIQTPAAVDLGPHAVSIGDMAKPYGLGGLRIGWIATHHAALRQRCAELRDYTSLCSSAPGEFLATLALDHRATILARHLATARRNRALWGQAMAGAEWLDWQLGDGGFTIFPQLLRGVDSAHFCRELGVHHDVLLLPGEVFEMPGHLRIGFGMAPADFAAALELLAVHAAGAPLLARAAHHGG